ncbi:CDP-glycerol glycerophosphotransferase family protein [Salinibacterium sp. ZJ450]|uniref:CDP-glycerol glycerophosphotransferase family protein n=1 Tax=Salinibacterium sp. ZJ450 TaxID=2708338 RepID=UPI0014220220|nr:CDP-glycerol glycerophosphotransferase family protein [Salinibacterium sp. ZJ450]
MSGFTFSAGNAAKLLSVPLYALGALATLVVQRRDTLWVFGSGSGVGEGSLELLHTVTTENPQVRAVWLARNTTDLDRARQLRIPAVLKDSWRGFRLTLRARVLVVTHGFGDVNRFAARGGFIVQLWHGIPLKRIHLDAPITFSAPRPLRRPLRALYHRAAQGIDLLPAASELAAERLRTAFGLPADRVVVTGDPRDDVLTRGTDEERRARADTLLHAKLGLDGSPRVVLFAPTWRDGAVDPSVPSAADWQLIDEWLQRTDSVLVVRPHPHSVGDYAAGAVSRRILLLDAARQNDITPVLPAVDVLITDYSSIAYDFALTGRPIFFLAPDVIEYSANRGLYEPYEAFSGGRETRSWAELVSTLGRAETDPQFRAELLAQTERLRNSHHAYTDGRNTQRVYAEILDRLAGDGSERRA